MKVFRENSARIRRNAEFILRDLGGCRPGEHLLLIADDASRENALALADVAYTIVAQVALRQGVDEHPAKYRDQFRRRVQRGQCHTQPYLGCREFAAYFGPAEPGEPCIAESMDLGPMLYDLDYSREARATPVFFPARLERGVVRYPAPEEVGLCF